MVLGVAATDLGIVLLNSHCGRIIDDGDSRGLFVRCGLLQTVLNLKP